MNRHMALLTEGGTGPVLSSINMALLTEGAEPRRGTVSAGTSGRGIATVERRFRLELTSDHVWVLGQA